ncbi:MAG: hypothetical protein VB140_00025 [Burkholderia sp.]
MDRKPSSGDGSVPDQLAADAIASSHSIYAITPSITAIETRRARSKTGDLIVSRSVGGTRQGANLL